MFLGVLGGGREDEGESVWEMELGYLILSSLKMKQL